MVSSAMYPLRKPHGRDRRPGRFLLLATACLGAVALLRWSNGGAEELNFVSGVAPARARGARVELNARKFFIGGNWKANGSPQSVQQLIQDLNAGEVQVDTSKDVEVVCAPPFVYLSQVQQGLRKDYAVAAQNVWDKPYGAWTGETPAVMLKEMGVDWVILGHSERRQYCDETSLMVADKTKFAVEAGLSTITCIGEQLQEREAGTTFDVIAGQLAPVAAALNTEDWSKVVLAYEPVWAIGTGRVATPEQAEEVHAFIRGWLREKVSPTVAENVRILYGGSVNDGNSAALGQKPNIDGYLVGGASLKGGAFTTIVNSAKVAAVSA